MTRRQLQAVSAMSAREIGWRTAYRVRLATERVELAVGRGPGSWPLHRVLQRSCTSGTDWPDRLLQRHRDTAGRFFSGVANRDAARRVLASLYGAECELARPHAAAAANHTFAFFGRRFQYGPEIDWNADPVTGTGWPRVFHADVLVNGGNCGYGDVKDVWELNRHQFLIDLGKSYFVDGVAAHAAEARAIVQHWRSQNPYGVGVNWACALEPAFRLLSWLWAYHFCLDDPALTGTAHLAWVKGFHEHAVFVARHLEHYSSPYNHLIGEACALYLVAVLFPEFREAAAWRRRARRVLEESIDLQFHRDGGSVEQSMFYHHATLGFYLLALIIGERNGERFSADLLRAVERAIAFSMYMAMPDGRTPTIGGGDDGKPIRLEHLPLWDFRPYQAIGAVLFRRPDFKFAAGRFHEDAFWLLGTDGLRCFDDLPSTAPAGPSRALDASGYFILRSDWSPRADYVCVDCGDQAGGLRTDAVPSAAHGHADCLSVIAVLAGTPVLVDPGFYTYNGLPEWEVHFRKTRAHNTASVDGLDQARHVAKMHWCEAARAQLEYWHDEGDQACVTGSHDGFARASDGVRHRRTVWLRPGGYLVIYDEFLGTGSHDIVANFQFAPGRVVRADDHHLTLDGGFELGWFSSVPIIAAVSTGRDDDPDSGWIAASLGVRVRAPRLKLRFRATGDAALMTIVTDVGTRRRAGRSRLVGQTCRAGGPLEAAVVGCDFVDWIRAGGDATPEHGMFSTDATLAIWRAANSGVLQEQVSIGGRRMQASPDAAAWLASIRRSTPSEHRFIAPQERL